MSDHANPIFNDDNAAREHLESIRWPDENSGPLGGEGKIVEANDAYHGKVEKPRRRARGHIPKPTKSGKSGSPTLAVAPNFGDKAAIRVPIKHRRVSGHHAVAVNDSGHGPSPAGDRNFSISATMRPALGLLFLRGNLPHKL